MIDSNSELLTKSKLTSMRKKWGETDSRSGQTWEYDGPYFPGEPTSYEHEMRKGLGKYGCKSFDELVDVLTAKLGRKPNVLDLMGGAYFLSKPENTETLTGIRIHDKDREYIHTAYRRGNYLSAQIKKLAEAPNRKVVEADILSNRGWKKIKSEDIPPADLLVCRPVGPFDIEHATGNLLENPKAYEGLYVSLFRRMLDLVDKNSGVIFTEVPDTFPDEEIGKFFAGIDRTEGSKSQVFTVPDEDYHWGGLKRRYAVVRFG